MSDPVLELRLDHAEKLIAENHSEIDNLKAEIEDMKAAEAARERKVLMGGIMVLGTVVTTLFGVIWAYRSEIFKG